MAFNVSLTAVNTTLQYHKRNLSQLARRFKPLTFAQKCYVVATIIGAATLLLGLPDQVFHTIIFSLVIVGMLHEGFPRFMEVWYSLPGKAVILFLYAVMANYALASASAMVNEVTGVSAQALPYSHNFAIILMLPSWFVVATLLTLVILQLVMPFYLLLLMLLKPFGIALQWHPPDYKYVLTTAVVRYIWVVLLLVKMSMIFEQTGVASYISDTLMSRKFAPSENPQAPLTATATKTVEDSDSPDVEKAKAEVIKNLETYKFVQRRLLAKFIFTNEADIFSRCDHPVGSRVIEINDYEILVVESLAKAKVGYTYKVIPCSSAAFGAAIQP